MIIAIIALLFIALARNSTLPRQASYEVFRYLAAQETNLKTIEFDETVSDNFKIKYLPSDEEYIGVVAQGAERAHQEVSEFFGKKPIDDQTVIIIYPNTESLAASFGWDKDEKAMGVYWGGTIRLLSPREWIGRGDLKEEFYYKGPIVHEFAHLLVDDMTRGNYTRWWTEAVAQYVEKQITGFEFQNPFRHGNKIKLYELSVLERDFDNLDQQIAYWQSLKIIEYIVDKHGKEKVFEILEFLGEGKNMTQALEKSLEIDINTFEQQYTQYIKNH